MKWFTLETRLILSSRFLLSGLNQLDLYSINAYRDDHPYTCLIEKMMLSRSYPRPKPNTNKYSHQLRYWGHLSLRSRQTKCALLEKKFHRVIDRDFSNQSPLPIIIIIFASLDRLTKQPMEVLVVAFVVITALFSKPVARDDHRHV